MPSHITKEVKKELLDVFKAETTWKCALFLSTSNCETNALTEGLYSKCTNELASGGGYATGGADIIGKTTGYVATINAYLSASNVAWPASTWVNVLYAVVYNSTTDRIRGVYKFSGNQSVTNGTFTIEWNSGGLMKVS
jgi:hypothetical protein